MATTNLYNFMSPTPRTSVPNLTTINQPARGNIWSRQTPETQAALIGAGTSLLGGALSQRNANQQNQQQMAFQGQQNDLNREASAQALAQQLAQARMLAERQAAMAGQQQTPARQDWRQRQALLADILPQARNVSIQAPGNLARFQGQISGGLRLPEGGLSPEALAFFSPEARMASEADLDRAIALASGGRAPTPSYGSVGYGNLANAQQTQNDVTSYSQQLREQMDEERQAALNEALGISPTPTAKGQSSASPFRRRPTDSA